MTDFLFKATKAKVPEQGSPPDSFLGELLDWAKSASDDIFALNTESGDILGVLRTHFGPWEGEVGSREWITHRKAALIEHARVHAGFESTWRWTCGVDITNKRSMANPRCAETGAFQVSLDSLALERTGTTLHDCIARHCGEVEVTRFLTKMKTHHAFALEYYCRLVRISTRWAGPINKGWTLRAMSAEAVAEWRALLAA